MLKQRIITAIILVPLFVLMVLKLSPMAFAVVTSLVVLWGAIEWSAFLGAKKLSHVVLFPILVMLALLAVLLIPTNNIYYILNIAMGWWLLALVLVVLYPKASGFWGKGIIWRSLMGLLVLIPCWLAVNYIRYAEGSATLLFLFILIWGADTGAYFVGKKWGKNKLAPLVSPGKTWQGLAGALAVTVLIAIGTSLALHMPRNMWLPIILLSLVTVLFSVLGDLFESMLKRNVDLKDSGRFLPGHGGILDRIDSLTAAAPIFVIGALWIGQNFQ